jgi:hypothetical protein
MTEHELRLLVREAIARHGVGGHVRLPADPKISPDSLAVSHGQFDVPSGIDACIIEPSVPCTHCGYCKSYGH